MRRGRRERERKGEEKRREGKGAEGNERGKFGRAKEYRDQYEIPRGLLLTEERYKIFFLREHWAMSSARMVLRGIPIEWLGE